MKLGCSTCFQERTQGDTPNPLLPPETHPGAQVNRGDMNTSTTLSSLIFISHPNTSMQEIPLKSGQQGHRDASWEPCRRTCTQGAWQGCLGEIGPHRVQRRPCHQTHPACPAQEEFHLLLQTHPCQFFSLPQIL